MNNDKVLETRAAFEEVYADFDFTDTQHELSAFHHFEIGYKAALAQALTQHSGEAVAYRIITPSGEQLTDWIDGTPPKQLYDLHDNPVADHTFELAYAAPAPVTPVGDERVYYVLKSKLEILQHCPSLHVTLNRYDTNHVKSSSEYQALYTRASMPVKDGDVVRNGVIDECAAVCKKIANDEEFGHMYCDGASECEVAILSIKSATVQDQGADPKQILLEALEGFLGYEGIEEFSIPYKTKRLVYSSVEAKTN